MPEGSTTFTDLVRGPVTFDHEHVPDFVLARADGSPLYTLAVAVDDILMKITHVVRGEDLLSSTPRQIAVYRAMGVPEDEFPVFAHLPYVLGKDGQRLSKRNGVVSVNWYRQEGFLPEAIDNYLALLGWSPGDNREEFTLADLAAEFDLARVNKNPAQFDVRKLEAINGDKIRALDPADFVARIIPFLQRAHVVGDPPSESEAALIAAAAPLIQTRISRLTEAPGMLGFLFADEERFEVDAQEAERALGPDALPVLQAAEAAVAEVRAVDVGGHPGRPDRGAGRAGRARPQAPGGVRAGAGRGDRTPGVPAAVPVDRAAGPGADAGPAGPRDQDVRLAPGRAWSAGGPGDHQLTRGNENRQASSWLRRRPAGHHLLGYQDSNLD